MSGFGAYSARELCSAIRSEKIRAVDVAEYHAAQIQTHQREINALSSDRRAKACEYARRCDNAVRSRESLGRLHGLCFTAKESIDVHELSLSDGGVNTRSVASSNAHLVDLLEQAGAFCIGKGNMAEYGKAFTTDNPTYGRSNNPFDISRSPGGSSGGDAAAVAADFAMFALAADSGGSVRIPANFCGLFGLCPTRGLLSAAGLQFGSHALVNQFRSNGIITRTLEDLDLLLSVLANFDSHDPGSVERPLVSSSQPRSNRFLLIESLGGLKPDAEISTALAATAKKFEAQGYKAETTYPNYFNQAPELFIILGVQYTLLLEDLIAEQNSKPRNMLSEGPGLQLLRKRLSAELPPASAKDLLLAWHRVDEIRILAAQLFESYDFILSPVTAILPPSHGATSFTVSGQKVGAEHVCSFANLANVLGAPALAFPTSLSQSGLPVGLQVMGPRFGERALIELLRTAGFTRRVLCRRTQP